MLHRGTVLPGVLRPSHPRGSRTSHSDAGAALSTLGALSSGTLFASFFSFLPLNFPELFVLVGGQLLSLLSPAFRGRHRTPGLCSVTAPELSIVIYI